MSYQVLALKYRPQTFGEVVGQSHVTTTLSNAIASDRVAHAILFTGPRGTGKTTIARILAKSMNCEKGPTSQPCNSCKICTNIIDGHCTDVFEIDGASNNSVDQVRELRESVNYMPSSAALKIYIIDEVHMLSTAAFNALLKTLEEPPGHVMFIFATTEAHKIPVTILSRCQRHDLGRISLQSISDHLASLSEKEGFQIEKQSLDLIAQEADGSMRDSLSLLDRILSLASTSRITHEQILESLGVLDLKIMHDIAGAVFDNDGARIIRVIETINDSGMDLKKFYGDIISHFRNTSVIKICGKESLAANITDSEKEKLFQSTRAVSGEFINAILQHLLAEESLVRYSSHTRTAIESVLLQLLQINPGARIDHIIERLDVLSKTISSKFPGQEYRPDPSVSGSPALQPEMKQVPAQELAVKETLQKHDVSMGEKKDREPEAKRDVKRESIQEDIPKTWPGFIKKIEKTFPFISALLSKSSAKESGPDRIIVDLKKCSSFDKKRLESKKRELENSCKRFLGKTLTLRIMNENNPLPQNSESKRDAKAKQAAFSHPLVVEAQKMFDGEIINY